MPDKFDAYRESLVMETKTNWPEEFSGLSEAQRIQLATELHADAEAASHLEYVRVHTGFCREITVTAEDLERLGVSL